MEWNEFDAEDRRLIDNKIWTRDELKKLRGKTARRRDKTISDRLHEVHRPYTQRENDKIIEDSRTILFDLS